MQTPIADGADSQAWIYQYVENDSVVNFRGGKAVVAVLASRDGLVCIRDMRTGRNFWDPVQVPLNEGETVALFDADPAGHFAVLATSDGRLAYVPLTDPHAGVTVSDHASPSTPITRLYVIQAGFAWRIVSIETDGKWFHRTINLSNEETLDLRYERFRSFPEPVRKLPRDATLLSASIDRTSSLWIRENGTIGLLANAGYKELPSINFAKKELTAVTPAIDSSRCFVIAVGGDQFIVDFRLKPFIAVSNQKYDSFVSFNYYSSKDIIIARVKDFTDFVELDYLETGTVPSNFILRESERLRTIKTPFDDFFALSSSRLLARDASNWVQITISANRPIRMEPIKGRLPELVSGMTRLTDATYLRSLFLDKAEPDDRWMTSFCAWALMPVNVPETESRLRPGERIFFLERNEENFGKSAITMFGRIAKPMGLRTDPVDGDDGAMILIEDARSVRGRAEEALTVDRLRDIAGFAKETALSGQISDTLIPISGPLGKDLGTVCKMHRVSRNRKVQWTPEMAMQAIADSPPNRLLSLNDGHDIEEDDEELEDGQAEEEQSEREAPAHKDSGSDGTGRDEPPFETGGEPPHDPADQEWYETAMRDVDVRNLPTRDDPMVVVREVEALSCLAVAEEFKPPLAIAVFGDWGAGKTTVMQSIDAKIEKLKGETYTPHSDGGTATTFLSDVVPVWFNAWHYAEANLIVSLAHAILSQIAEHLSEDNADVLNQAFEVQRTLEEREKRLAQDIDALEELKRKAILEQNEPKAVARAAWAAISGTLSDPQKIEDAARSLGFDKFDTNPSLKLIDAVRDGNTAVQAARLAVSGWRSIGFTVLAVAVTALLGYGMTTLLPAGKDWIGWATAGALGISAFLRQFLVGVQKSRALLSDIVDTFDAHRAATVVGLEQKIADTETARAELEAEKLDVARRIRRIEEGLTPEQVVDEINDILRRRLDEGEYAEHLGMVSTIRDDFRRLSNILQGKAPDKGEAAPRKGKSVDRVVLFIDDLDRCPPDRVVDVMQAVHLLLSFPIFICYVGVDSRWLKRSIAYRYRDTIGDGRSNGNATLEIPGAGPVSTDGAVLLPSDYLEKVFHLSYWVPHMKDNNKMRVLLELLRRGVQEGTDERFGIEGGLLGAIEGLTNLTRGENSYLQSLGRFAGNSPRRLQRFVNGFKLYRGTVATSQREFQLFATDVGGLPGFLVAGAAIAVISRCRDIGPDFLRSLYAQCRRPEFKTLNDDGTPKHPLPDEVSAALAAHRDRNTAEAAAIEAIFAVLIEMLQRGSTFAQDGLPLEVRAGQELVRTLPGIVRFSLFEIKLADA